LELTLENVRVREIQKKQKEEEEEERKKKEIWKKN